MIFVITIFFTLGIHGAMTIYYLAEKGVAQWSASGTLIKNGIMEKITCFLAYKHSNNQRDFTLFASKL